MLRDMVTTDAPTCSAAAAGLAAGAAGPRPLVWLCAAGALLALDLARRSRPYPTGRVVAGRVSAEDLRASIDGPVSGRAVREQVVSYRDLDGREQTLSDPLRTPGSGHLGAPRQVSLLPGSPPRLVRGATAAAGLLLGVALGGTAVGSSADGAAQAVLVIALLLALARAFLGATPARLPGPALAVVVAVTAAVALAAVGLTDVPPFPH